MAQNFKIYDDPVTCITKVGLKFIFHFLAKSEGNFSGRCWKYKLYFKNSYDVYFDA